VNRNGNPSSFGNTIAQQQSTGFRSDIESILRMSQTLFLTAVKIEGMICLILPALLVSLNPHSNVLRGVDSQTVQMFAPFGQHSVTFDVPNVASGAYLCMVEAGRFVDVKKLLLLC
jgi:hypothetical protein